MGRQRLLLVFLFCVVAGCSAEKPLVQQVAQPVTDSPKPQARELTEQEKLLDAQYSQAFKTWQEKQAPISDYIASVCSPKQQDAEYLACLNSKNSELIAIHYLPALVIKMLEARKASEQALLDKKISRVDFIKQEQKLQNSLLQGMMEQAVEDLKTGTYSGKY